MPRKEAAVQDDDVLLALVCQYLAQGLPPARIKERIEVAHKISMKGKNVWQLVEKAGKKGWLSFVSTEYKEIRERMLQEFPSIETHVAVNLVDDVATHGAAVVLDLIKQRIRPPRHKEVVHVGFSGGHTVRRLFRVLSRLLTESVDPLPKKIVFHALVGGFSTDAPGTDPTSFFTYLADPKATIDKADIGFVLFHAPPIIQPNELGKFFDLPAAKDAQAQALKLDVVVTSAAVFDHEHSQLAEYYSTYSPATLDLLRADNCVGDMLWLPIKKEGPIVTDKYPFRAVTLLELNKLPELIGDDRNVVLALGPCAVCGAPKAKVLDAILNLPEKYITHLVTDARTAQEVLEMRPKRTLEVA